MSAMVAILVTGCGTYFCRAVFIIALANKRIPPTLQLAMEYVGPAVMAALVITMLVGGEGASRPGLAEGLALLVAGVTAWKTRNHLATLGAGMAVFWLLRALVS